MNFRNFLTANHSDMPPRSIIDHLSNHFICWKDKNSVFLGCNKAFANSVGLNAPEDIIGKTDYDLPWLKVDSDKYIADDRQVMESKLPKLNIEESQTLIDGNKRILLTNKVPLFDGNKNVYGVLVIYSDITEQKHNEQKLIEMHQKLVESYQIRSSIEKQLQNSIIDHLPHHFIFWKDKNSVYLGCNAAFAASLGFHSPNEIIGKTDYDLPVKKEDSDAYIAFDQEVMLSKKPKLNIEEPQTLADGTIKVLLTSKMPLFDQAGHVYGVLAIYSDITEQKLNENKLIEAHQKLERSYKVKSEFIRNISHDIRTPLAGIQQTVRAISDGKIPEAEIPEYAYAAWEASNKLLGLFNQIIDVSKNEHYNFEDQVVKFDLYDLLDGLKKTYEVVSKHKGLKLEIEYTENIPHYLLGKHLRLHRILMNLLGNALKFTDNGHVKLIVEQAQADDEKVTLRFSVIDTGIGIPEEKHDIIFEPFSRLTPSFQGQYPGSGLGLHVVKDYVEKMQGEIYVESSIGKGTMFTCVLPFKRPILNNDNDIAQTAYIENLSIFDIIQPPERTPKIAATSMINDHSLQRVLLVEDDQLGQSMGALILRTQHYQVDVAKSGEEALKLCAQHHYQVIYLDVGLPGIDGIETARRIRNNKFSLNQNSYIAALTAHADEVISKQCLEAGMQQILIKPLTPEKSQKIQNILDKPENNIQENIKAVDFDLWRTRLGENAYMLDELFNMLAKDFPSNKQAITNAYEEHDLCALKSVAHKMKGGLQYCALPRLEAAIKSIEGAAKNNNVEEVNQYYQETLNALDEAMQVYKQWCATHSTS